ncbi:glycosyltransferase family 4 protein [Flavobacterium sp.]|uniref:glycosyltransferase family 4 protein n=1 Tax=Flavobacterium sp. TaxID=239 RepID=UPI002B4B08B2|nr:glycosyltransferase family 4 protein [Flavobacterium sp.]HLF51239.1 glycosyltransferase family 4 protein [Flavobacterium sp.]
MKIAFLTSEYPHLVTGTSGGLGTSIKSLAVSLVNQGHSARILVYGQKEEGLFEDHGVVVQRIKNIKVKGLSWYLTRKKFEKIINQLYNQQELDLVEVADWTGISSFIQPQCPLVIRLHGSDTYFCHLDHRPVKWINRFHEKRALQKANGHISVSHYTAIMTNQLFGLNKDFTIIPNSIDCSDFISEQKVVATPPIVLYFGTLIRKKGLLELPFIFNKVIEQHPTAQLYLIGRDSSDIISGNASTWTMMLELFTPKALVNVTYFGGVSYDEIKKHIQKATVCVFPTFAEALPLSWLEAMAMEKAVVASNIGWAQEIIEEGKSGFLVDPKDHQVYADKICTLIEDAELTKQIGGNARKRIVTVFDVQKVIHQNIAFYQSIIK